MLAPFLVSTKVCLGELTWVHGVVRVSRRQAGVWASAHDQHRGSSSEWYPREVMREYPGWGHE